MALLTIDDAPSPLFGKKLDWLIKEKVPAVFFVWGEKIRGQEEVLVRALKAGYPLANHAWSHPQFSTLTWDEAVDQIVKTERALDDLYARAGVVQKARAFRFPYLNRGEGDQVAQLQSYLAGRGYRALPGLPAEWVDSSCTFDQAEYWIGNPGAPDGLDKPEAVLARIAPGSPAPHDVILIHDHDYTHEVFFECIRRYRDLGLTFEVGLA